MDENHICIGRGQARFTPKRPSTLFMDVLSPFTGERRTGFEKKKERKKNSSRCTCMLAETQKLRADGQGERCILSFNCHSVVFALRAPEHVGQIACGRHGEETRTTECSVRFLVAGVKVVALSPQGPPYALVFCHRVDGNASLLGNLLWLTFIRKTRNRRSSLHPFKCEPMTMFWTLCFPNSSSSLLATSQPWQ